MALMLDEDESFSLSANITSPGYQSLVLKGLLVSRRSDGVYVAPLIPQLFYGASGEQLSTWRQWIPETGEQVILSRSGGEPSLPREELFWRKISEPRVQVEPAEAPKAVTNWAPFAVGGLIGGIAAGLILFSARRHK